MAHIPVPVTKNRLVPRSFLATTPLLSRAARRSIRKTWFHSHSIVAGGFELTSYVTRLMPRTSLMMRPDTFFSSP